MRYSFATLPTAFLAWAVAAVVGAAVLAAGASSLLSSGAHEGVSPGNPSAYYVDSLFRSDLPNANTTDQDVRAEANRILAIGIRSGVPTGDQAYLAQLVAARTGLSQADAEKRVAEVIANAKADADAARKAAAYLSIFIAVSMLIGAFIAAAAAALGGLTGTRTGEFIRACCGKASSYRRPVSSFCASRPRG
jgi:hypothetical protein